jgi:lipopolysaccharide export system protein LptA
LITTSTKRYVSAIALLLAGLLGTSAAQALPDDRAQPIHISAKTVDVNQKTGVSSYRGDVVLTQGSLRIEADRIVVQYRGGKVQMVSAFGTPVTFRERPEKQQPEIIGSAARLEYHADQNRIDLYDGVAVRQGEDVLQSNLLHYDLATSSLSAEAGSADERVQTVIQPNRPVLPGTQKK